MPHRSPRSLRSRAGALTAATTLALIAGLAPSAIGSSATATSEVFAPQLVTVDTPTRAAKQRLQKLGLDLTEHAGHDYVEVVLHTALDRQRLVDHGFTFDVRIPDLVRRTAEVNAINARFAAATVRSKMPSGRDTYRTLADYNADLAALAKQHPRLAKTFKLKHPSLDGRPVYGVEIGRDVRSAPDGRPTFALFGLHHAREWPSGELAMEFAIDLVKSYGRNDRITRLLKRARVVVVPVVNVDGFHLSRTDGGMIDLRELDRGGTASLLGTPGNAYKRKNCRVVDGQDTPDGSCAAASATSPGGFGIGVDLNRNYGGFWGGPGASGPTPDAEQNTGVVDPTYRGASAFSEPETQNIQDLISKRQVTMMISNHTFSNLVLRPNGVHPDTIGPDGHPVGDAPDEQHLKAIGAKMTAQNGYRNIHGWELYDTTGTTEDWSYNATGGFGYTFEIGAHEFHPPYPEVIDEYRGAGAFKGKGNREAYLIALEQAVANATHSRIVGKAPKGATLRLTKSFQTPTWESSFKDSLNTVMKSRGGDFVWHVNPSTRPVVMEKVVVKTEDRVLRTKTYEGGPTEPVVGVVDHEFTVTEADADELLVTLEWPVPTDDFDLEVYLKNGSELKEVGSSGNAPGSFERVELADPQPGTYVLRVINFAAVSPTYTLEASTIDETVVSRETVGGKTERWTLTCEKRGRVLQTVRVNVERGDLARVNLAQCRRRF
ncbi:MAG TPA: M14 family zinc carboxypeptidase [Nocardioides sp.]|nr:M14 family zinc carboxypeptidase [Nocardioides sp.]